MAKAVVPGSVSERFAPSERPIFKLLRRVGPCRLWRSQTVAHEVYGHIRPARVHYHVTVGDEAFAVLVPQFKNAMALTEMLGQEKRRGSAKVQGGSAS